MKANQLRIGNYVFENDNKIKQVEHIFNNTIYTKSAGKQLHKPIPLTEQWLLDLGFEDWGYGNLYSNEYEKYKRYVMHNVLDGTSNLEVHFITSTYGNRNDEQFILSCDEDDRINFGVEIEHVHTLQNMVHSLTDIELTL